MGTLKPGSRFFITMVVLTTGSLALWLSFFVLPLVLPPFEFSAQGREQPAAEGPALPVVSYLSTPEVVRAVYLTSWTAGSVARRAELIRLIEETEINAVVIDVKDFSGRVAFAVKDPGLKVFGSEEKRIPDIDELLSQLHEKGIYVIARIAVFQDPFLAEKRPDLAVKRASDGKIWRDFKGLAWLDPAAREVWDYVVTVAKEARARGFDELNFDYIRFPSDGNMRDIAYPFFDPARQTKSAVLKEFFLHLRSELNELNVPLSADLFGMSMTNTDDLNIGQILEDAAPYFDFIAPMVYPSHYPSGFLGHKNPAAAPYEIINHALQEAARRLTAMGDAPAKLRPWLQDFDLGAIYTAEMVLKEKQAVYDAGLRSWMLWSPANRYTLGALEKDE